MKRKHLINVGLLLTLGFLCTMGLGMANAETTITHYPDSNVEYTLNKGFSTESGFTAGTITISDGETTITMLDRNLGATKSGTGCSYLGTGTCGYHFQWGNNYGFKPSTTNSTAFPNGETATKDERVDTSSYGPSEYSGNIFRKTTSSPYDWSDPKNDNLRGGSGDTYSNSFPVTNATERQGPCPEGFHVPSVGEYSKLLAMLGSTSSDRRNKVHNELLIPFAGVRFNDKADIYGWSKDANLRSSSPYGAGARYLYLSNYQNVRMNNNEESRANGFSVRCFYDSYDAYPWTPSFSVNFYDSDQTTQIWSGEVESGTILADSGTVTDILSGYQNSKTGYTFNGWIISGTDTAINLSDPITTGLELVASWTMDTYNLSIDLNGGTLEAGATNPTSYNVESDDITLKNPVREGYTFAGWTGTDLITPEVAVTIAKGSTGDREYFANWTANEYTITFKDGSGTETDVVWTGNYGDTVTATYPSWTKTGYTGAWDTTIPATVPAENTVITMNRTAKPRPTSGGGGSSLKKDNCPNGDYSDSYYDGICGNKDSSSQTPQNDNLQSSGADAKDIDSTEGLESNKLQTAYEWAHQNGITTMDTVEKADLNGNLTRIAMAKMLSKYAINVLGMEPDENIDKTFSDVPTSLDKQYDNGVSLAYQLGIMGINMPDERFRPFDLVPRSEFVTALSRMKYGTPDGEYVGTAEYYKNHMEILSDKGIVSLLNPEMLELRGYVMLMLMRSEK